MRVRRQLVDQYREWLLRRTAVQPEYLACERRLRHAARGQPRRADRHRQEASGRRWLGRLAGVLFQARLALAQWPTGCWIPRRYVSWRVSWACARASSAARTSSPTRTPYGESLP